MRDAGERQAGRLGAKEAWCELNVSISTKSWTSRGLFQGKSSGMLVRCEGCEWCSVWGRLGVKDDCFHTCNLFMTSFYNNKVLHIQRYDFRNNLKHKIYLMKCMWGRMGVKDAMFEGYKKFTCDLFVTAFYDYKVLHIQRYDFRNNLKHKVNPMKCTWGRLDMKNRAWVWGMLGW